MENYVWYACYGSNLNEGRFNYYIKGGKYPVNGSIYSGCGDETDFIEKANMTIKHGLYFAEKSPSWEDKAVAFITSNSSDAYETKCVLYKVTTEQFIDIFLQENGKIPKENIDIISPDDLEDIKPEGQKKIGKDNENAWYGKLLRLEDYKDGCPIYTFTSKTPDDAIEAVEPGEKYLNVIGKGLLDNFELSEDEVVKYLFKSNGICNSSWTKEKIALLFQPKFTVIATGKRNAPKGEFIAQLNENDLTKYSLDPELSEVIISYNIKNTPHIFKTAVKIQKYPEQDNVLSDGYVALDQTIRDAIGCDKKIDNSNEKSEEQDIEEQDINDYTVRISFPNNNYFTRLKMHLSNCYKKLSFDKQLNIVRVFKATPNDMEINICRLSESTMQSVGIEDGDKVKVKSIANEICIRALVMNENDRTARKNPRYVKVEGGYEKLKELRELKRERKSGKLEHELKNNEEKTKNGLTEELMAENLAMIFLDNDARQELQIELGDPVTIYRSNRFAIGKNIQAVTIPLLLTFLGIGLNLENIKDSWVEANLFWISPAFYVIFSIFLICVNLWPIRNKFK